MRTADAIVIGAGVVGLSSARALSAAGKKVLVLERRRVGAEASSAAAGMLAPQGEAEPGSRLLPLALRARDHHLALAPALLAETGIPVEMSARGAIHVALSADEEGALAEKCSWQREQGLAATTMSADEVRDAEPNLSGSIRAGLLLPGDRWLDNVRLVRALAVSAVSRGATLVCGRPVTRLLEAEGRVTGVRAGGETFSAPVVINAAGAWAGMIEADPAPPPVEPVRGQMLAFELAVPLVQHVIVSPRGYLVPRLDGRLLVGSTSDRVGFDKGVTAGGLRDLLDTAIRLVPGLADVRVAETWAGLRPGTPDEQPVIGAGALGGLFHAAGLYRNGILLGPLVGEIVADLALGRAPAVDVDLAPFSPARFARGPKIIRPPR
jgi:glycine oxidase